MKPKKGQIKRNHPEKLQPRSFPRLKEWIWKEVLYNDGSIVECRLLILREKQKQLHFPPPYPAPCEQCPL